MSAFLTHTATGALFGMVGVLLVHAYQIRSPDGTRISWLEAFVAIGWCAVAASLADIDLVLGEHRTTLTNVWVLLALPAFVGSWLLWTRLGQEAALRAVIPVLPGAMGSHLLLDTFGFTNRHAALFWPLTDTVYVTPAHSVTHRYGGIAAMDSGTPIFLFVVFMVLLAWAHVALSERLLRRDDVSTGERVGFAVGTAMVALVPILLLKAVGLLRPA